MTEAVLHWESWVRVTEVEGAPSHVIIPIAYIDVSTVVEVESFLPIQTETGWEFQLKYRDEELDVLHYYCIEPPWAVQIRSIMSHVKQQIEHLKAEVA